MTSEPIADDELRAVVVDTLKSEPGATLAQIQTRLRARIGRTLESEESQRLNEIYRDEGYAAAASTVVSDKAAHTATAASLSHARPNVGEITALIAAIVPFFVPAFQSGASRSGVGAGSSYFNLIALAGGVIALIAGAGAIPMLSKGPQRPFHLALIGLVLVLGLYQVILGVGLLHRFGVYQVAMP